MQLQEVFWQAKLSPKQLIIDWDKFISLFDEFILQTISLKLNHVQKDYIKALIDPQNRNIVYKNSYLLFVNNFWQLPSNRTKLLKGQVNLSKIQKPDFVSDLRNEDIVILKIQYLSDFQELNCNTQNNSKELKEQCYELRNNKLCKLDQRNKIISEQSVNVENFLTLGRGTKNDICIQDCDFINLQHLKLIKMVTKKKKQKKPFYMYEQNEDKNDHQINWCIRDISRSNRLQYLLTNSATYVVLRPGMTIKFGLTHQYELQIVSATPNDITEPQIKQLTTLLNSDRINFLGDIDPSIPEKIVLDFPADGVNAANIQNWFDKGCHYEDNSEIVVRKRGQLSKVQEELALSIRLVDKVTQQAKDYKFPGQSVKIGRNKKNQISIDRVTMRNVECELLCVTGIWMIRNVEENCLREDRLKQSQRVDFVIKKLRIKGLSVGLAVENAVDILQCSNKIILPALRSHQVGGKNFIVDISFPKARMSNK